MFGFKKKNKSENTPSKGLFSSLKSKLGKTRSQFTSGLSGIFSGAKALDEQAIEELEDLLIMSDVGIETTAKIIDQLNNQKLSTEQTPEELFKSTLEALLEPCVSPFEIQQQGSTFVILMIGINGAGKTTTIGKLAQKFQQQGLSVMLAAGDTFRAAAVEQLQTWGERLNIPVINQGTGADAASVIFDALQSAQAKNIDVLIADTAGRLHTQDNLMDELEKIKR
ncbi:MAG: signal recognition particle-docking protein FtsY, partial [Bacteroidetes bacterium]|nr:signal recognition particle-docking protein FtsY [Bacteroidota bacterium]